MSLARTVVSVLSFLSLWVGILVAGEPAPTAKPPAAKEFNCQISLQITDNQNFRYNAEAPDVDASTTISIKIRTPKPCKLMLGTKGIAGLVDLDPVKDNTGAVLQQDRMQIVFSQRMYPTANSYVVGGVILSALGLPAREATAIQQIRGTLHLLKVTHEEKLVVKPLIEALGKEYQISLGRIVFEKMDTTVLHFSLKGKGFRLEQSVVTMDFYAGDGTRLPGGYGANWNNDEIHYRRNFYKGLPKDAYVVVHYPTETQPVSIPFAAEQIPLAPLQTAPNIGELPPANGYHLYPIRLSIDREQHIRFDQQRSQHRDTMNIDAELFGKKGDVLVADIPGINDEKCYILSVAEDNTGYSLLGRNSRLDWNTDDDKREAGGRLGTVRICHLKPPSAKATSIKRIEGSFFALRLQGTRTIDVKPLIQHLNKPFDLGHGRILTFSKAEDRVLQWFANFRAYPKTPLLHMDVRTKDGKLLGLYERSTLINGNKCRITARLSQSLAPGAYASIEIPKTSEIVRIPFILKNISLNSQARRIKAYKTPVSADYELKPLEIKISDDVHIDLRQMGNRPPYRRQNMDIQLEIYSKTPRVVSYFNDQSAERHNAIEVARDDTGANLISSQTSISTTFYGGEDHLVGVLYIKNLALPAPTAKCLAKLKGWALVREILQTAKKDIPLRKDQCGKLITLANGQTFSLTQTKGKRIEYTANFHTYTERGLVIGIYRRDGRKIKVSSKRSLGWRNGCQRFEILLHDVVPDGGHITLTYPAKSRLVRIPFELSNLAILPQDRSALTALANAVDDPNYEVRLERVSIHKHVLVTPSLMQGFHVERDYGCSAQIRLLGREQRKLLPVSIADGIAAVTLKTVRDNTGWNLLDRNSSTYVTLCNGQDIDGLYEMGQIDIDELLMPAPAAKTLAILEGDLYFREVTEYKSITIVKIADTVAKPIPLGIGTVTIASIKDNSLVLDLRPCRENMEIHIRQGGREICRQNYLVRKNRRILTFDEAIRPDATATLRYPDKVKLIHVPFRFTNISLSVQALAESRK